jgi:hypothetical protein
MMSSGNLKHFIINIFIIMLLKGLTECEKVTHDHSRLIMSIIEESRKQIGYFLNDD